MKMLLVKILKTAGVFTFCLSVALSSVHADEDNQAPVGPGIRKVELNPDGNLIGQVQTSTGQAVPATSVVVTFYQDGQIVGTAETGEGGLFEVPNLTPGVYSVVVEGPGGVTSFPLLVLPSAGGPEGTPNRLILSIDPALVHLGPGGLGPDGVPPPPPFPFGGGPMGPGGGFGGGVGGGGDGLWGALLGAAGVGLGAAALADNDGGGETIVIASPAGP